MYSAVSGLQAHQTKMNVIGNNISNVNTYGFKASRVTFSDVFYQTMTGASSPTANGGGTNPTQLGYGAKVNSIDIINTRAGSATTDRALDVYINGDGYLPVKDSEGVIRYTRVGVLSFDAAGNLVDRNGNMVLGFLLDPNTGNPRLDANGTTSVQNLAPIKVPPEELDKYTGISIGPNGEITAIKEGDPVITLGVSTGWIRSATLPVTSNYTGEITVTNATAAATVHFIPGTNPDGTAFPANSIVVPNNADVMGPMSVRYNASANTLELTYKDKAGAEHTVSASWDGTSAGTLTFAVPNTATPSADVDIEIKVGGTDGITTIPTNGDPFAIGTVVPSSVTMTVSTYDKSGSAVTVTGTWTAPGTGLQLGDMALTVNPAAFGTLDISALAGRVIGSAGPGPGTPEKIAHLATVKFMNADGLSQEGEGYYVETSNSGSAVATIPGNGGTGNLRSGALEMSNVDLSKEFTEMIITQRGFQANARMITVSDEMLSELVNMKR